LPQRALRHRLLLNVTAERVIRLLPPLTLSDAECDELLVRLLRVIREFSAEGTGG
jgi:acetylornithine aminotransferase